MISPFPPRSFQGWRHFGSRTRSTENRHSNRIQGIYFSAKQQLRHPLALFSNLGTRPHFGVWKICGQEARGAGVRAARGKGRPLSRSIAPRKPAFRQTRRSVGLIRPAKFARISPSPSQVTTPRLIGPKEGGHQEAGLSKGWRGPLPIRGTDGAISAEGAVAAWGRGCRAPGRRRMRRPLPGAVSWARCED